VHNTEVNKEKVDIGSFAIIENRQGEILLVRHGYGEKEFSLPGGGLEKGETADLTIIREAQEETGICDVFFEHIGTFFLPTRAGIVFLFYVKMDDVPCIAKNVQEIMGFAWVNSGELPIGTSPNQIELIKRWRDNDLGNCGRYPFDLL